MRVSGKRLLKVSTGVPTTSNVGPASSWNSVIAMGVLECSHSAVSAEVRIMGVGTGPAVRRPQPYAAIHVVDKRHTDRNIEKVA